MSCMRDICLFYYHWSGLLKVVFGSKQKPASHLVESDESANRPRVPPAVHYPRSSAGPNELISSSRADIESKREERERKKNPARKLCWRVARRSQVFRMRHNQSACPRRSHVAASLLMPARDKRPSLCADGPPAVTRSDALYTLRPSCHRTSVTKRICNAIWWEKMLQPCRDHWHPAAVLCGMFCGLGDVYWSAEKCSIASVLAVLSYFLS